MLTLQTKINRMFELRHNVDQPERSNEDVAAALSHRLGKTVDPQTIAAARSGQSQVIARDIAEALCAEFDIEPSYLLGDDESEITRAHLLMQLWILIRDKGEVLQREALHAGAERWRHLDTDTIRDMISSYEAAPVMTAPSAVVATSSERAHTSRRRGRLLSLFR
ncbi:MULTISPECIES: hypothetical protein [Nocardia]|uniref:Uncharacterized protein n=1 Tax=Nocardia africana TaxID=134964 RepID=A0A378WII9_9NOCA|nr:hypothetical protein [Nocardia africana]MCC3317996.1 hypothetical protein [Nocardia africana]SUA40722.1 Uncharacterised protein [Nocardia africana]